MCGNYVGIAVASSAAHTLGREAEFARTSESADRLVIAVGVWIRMVAIAGRESWESTF